MKKTYIQPATTVAATRMQVAFLAGSTSDTHQSTYGGGEKGDQNSNTDNIGTAGDNDNFTMESKYNAWNQWDDED